MPHDSGRIIRHILSLRSTVHRATWVISNRKLFTHLPVGALTLPKLKPSADLRQGPRILHHASAEGPRLAPGRTRYILRRVEDKGCAPSRTRYILRRVEDKGCALLLLWSSASGRSLHAQIATQSELVSSLLGTFVPLRRRSGAQGF